MNNVIFLNSSIYTGLVTHDAYMEIRILMNGGEFMEHTFSECKVNDLSGVLTKENVYVKWFENNTAWDFARKTH